MAKNLAKIMGILLLSLTTACATSYKSIKKIKKGEKLELFFKNFPSEIPKAEKIEKFYIPGSKYCLVHIRQIHYVKGVGRNKKWINEIYTVQKNIYGILNFLIDKKTIKSIRPEGLIKYTGNEKIKQNTKRDITYIAAETIKQRAKKYYEMIKRETGKEYVGGAVKKLILEDRINAKPSEILKTRIKIKIMKRRGNFTRESFSLYKWYIMEKREDDLFELIANDSEQISFTTYGGAHAWGGKKSCGPNYSLKNRDSTKDNLYEWNRKNPDKKFSLIEITPKNYRK